MANKPFDQRIINLLERPTSSDLNIAQSQLNLGGRALMRQLLQPNPTLVGTGSLGESFFVEKTAGNRNFKIKRGVGFNYVAYNSATDDDIGGVSGLSDPFDYRMVSIQDEAGVAISVPAAPSAGQCRRDVIAIRCSNPTDAMLEDSQPTDIYDPTPGVGKFDVVTKPKTFSYDISGATQEVVNYDAVSGVTAQVVYITGQVVSYSEPDSLLNAPVALPAPTYLRIAVVNVVGGALAVAQSDVVDFRRLVSPQGNLVVSGSATIGSVGVNPGARLQGVTLKTPPGIKAQIWKVKEGTSNSYALVVYGPRNVTTASLTLQREDPADRYALLVAASPGFADRPIELVAGPKAINGVVNNEAKTLAASASASPTQAVAIGQPYHVFPFTLCRVDNTTEAVTEPLTLTLNLDPITFPNSPADAWPSGTYNVAGHSNYRTFYLEAGTPPSLPTSGVPSPTYLLSNTLTPAAEWMIEVGDIGEVYERVVGFLANSQSMSWGNGIWRLPMAAIGLPMSGSAFGAAPVAAVVKVFGYNGATDPESGALLAQSQEVILPINNANAPEFVEFFIDEIGGVTWTTSRLYIALFVKKIPLSSYPANARFYFNYTPNNNVAFLETNIPATAPTVTLPPKTDRWPAGVVLQPEGTATSTPVTLNVAGELQRLNPAALVVDIPITFTLNMTVE